MIKKALTSLTMSSALAILCFQMAFGPTALHAQQRPASISAIPGQINAESLKLLHISPAEFASLQPLLEKLIQFNIDLLTWLELDEGQLFIGGILIIVFVYLCIKSDRSAKSERLSDFVFKQNIEAFNKYTAPILKEANSLAPKVTGYLNQIKQDITNLKAERVKANKALSATELSLLEGLENLVNKHIPERNITTFTFNFQSIEKTSWSYRTYEMYRLKIDNFAPFISLQEEKLLGDGYFEKFTQRYDAEYLKWVRLEIVYNKLAKKLTEASEAGVNLAHIFEGYDSLELIDPKDIEAKLEELSRVTQHRKGATGAAFNLLHYEYTKNAKVKLPEGLKESLSEAVERVERVEANKGNGGGVAMFMVALAASTYALFQNRTIESGQQSFWDRKLTRNMPREDRERLLFELILTFGAKRTKEILKSTAEYPDQLRSILELAKH